METYCGRSKLLGGERGAKWVGLGWSQAERVSRAQIACYGSEKNEVVDAACRH